MAAPTVYKWTDAGAPQITRGNKSDYQALFQAVLIDGYGAKAAPGAGTNKWSIPYSDATSFVLRQGGSATKKACLKLHGFTPTVMSYARCEAANDYSDIDTPVEFWAGTNTYDIVPLGYSSTNSYHIPWIIIATERVIICQFGYNAEGVDSHVFDTTRNDSVVNNSHWYFGDYKCEEPSFVNNQVLFHTRYVTTLALVKQVFTSANEVTTSIKNFAATYNDTWNGEIVGNGYFTRPISEGAVPIGSSRTHQSAPLYPSPLNGGLYLERYRIGVHGAIMGELYGVLIPIQRKPFPSQAGQYTFAGQGDYTGEDIMVFGDGAGQYMIRLGDWGVE